MSTSSFFTYRTYVLLFAVLFLMACPPLRDQPYPLSNPIFSAHQHSFNLDSLQKILAPKGFFKIEPLAGGLSISYPYDDQGISSEYWLNDSVLVLKVNSMPYTRRDLAENRSGKIRFEQKLRARKKAFIDRHGLYFTNFQSLIIGNQGLLTQQTSLSYDRSFSYFDGKHLSPIENFHTTLPIFGNLDTMKFSNGIFYDAFKLIDEKRGLVYEGRYENNLEVGDWVYYDSLGQLQWTEFYEAGELQKVVYTEGAHRSRAEPLPTVKSTLFLHQIILFVLSIIAFLLGYAYFRFMRISKSVYGSKEVWMTVLLVILNMFVFAVSLFFFVLTFFCIHGLFFALFGWDLPYEILNFIPFCLLFILFEIIFFMGSGRVFEAPFHGALFAIGVLIFLEYYYIISLSSGMP